jgi:hypothetical protein|tara:strand:- start:94 stop:303 length:210 start_codon:yes stop_codon:yes gene_type:complete
MIKRIITGDYEFMKKKALPRIWRTGVKKVRVKQYMHTIMDIHFDATDEQFTKFDKSIKRIDGKYSIEKF